MIEILSKTERYSFKFNHEALAASGSYEKSEGKLVRMDAQVKRGEMYIGNVAANTMDGKVRVSTTNVAVEDLSDVNEVAELLIAEIDSSI